MKNRKTLLSVILAVIMILSCISSVFAADVKINGTVEGHTYEFYKVFDLVKTTSGTTDNYDYTINDDFAGFFTANGMTIADVLAMTNNSDELSNLAADLLEYAVANNITAAKTVAAANEATATTVTGLDDGYYLMNPLGGKGASGGTASMFSIGNVVTGETNEITVKADYPTIEKYMYATGSATDKVKVNNASMGDTINYVIEGSVPDMTGYTRYRYVIVDTMCEGITYDEDSIEITIGTVTLIKGTDYDVVYVADVDTADDTNNDQSIKVIFKNFKAFCTDNGIDCGDAITVEYSGTLNDKALINLPNENTALLKYSNSPKFNYSGTTDHPDDDFGDDDVNGITPMSVTKTYTTTVIINKVDADNTPLKGAEFTITGGSVNNVLVSSQQFVQDNTNGTYRKLIDNTYTTTAPTTETASQYASETDKYVLTYKETYLSEAGADRKAFVGEDGKLVLTGLGEGTYTITESTVPEYYNGIEPFTITISFDTDTKTFSAKQGETDLSTVAVNGNDNFRAFSVTVVNHTGTLAPSTGGIGTKIFYIAGGAIVICAAVVLISKKRMSAK